MLFGQFVEHVGQVESGRTVDELVHVCKGGVEYFMSIEQSIVKVSLCLRVVVFDEHGHEDYVIIEVFPDLVHISVFILDAQCETFLVEFSGIAVLPKEARIRGVSVIVV